MFLMLQIKTESYTKSVGTDDIFVNKNQVLPLPLIKKLNDIFVPLNQDVIADLFIQKFIFISIVFNIGVLFILFKIRNTTIF